MFKGEQISKLMTNIHMGICLGHLMQDNKVQNKRTCHSNLFIVEEHSDNFPCRANLFLNKALCERSMMAST